MYGITRGPNTLNILWARQPDNSYEEFIVKRYSTPGLSRNVLTRDGKRFQLDGLGLNKFPQETSELLDKLFPC